MQTTKTIDVKRSGHEEKEKDIFRSLDAKTFARLAQELIDEGVSHGKIRKNIGDVYLEALLEVLVEKRIDVTSPHPVFTFMEEHRVILDSLNQLDGAIKRLKKQDSFQDMGEDLKLFEDIAHHLVEAESHHQREEDVLFSELQKHDITAPAEIIKIDHTEFRKRKKALYNFTYNRQDYSFEDYKKNVIELGEYLVKELESHIFKEDNILYQIALQVLSQEEWAKIKKECDKIGYCCFTPDDQLEKVVELDLRQMPPFERHGKSSRSGMNLIRTKQ